LLQPEDESGLYRCRNNQEWEHDGEIPPEGMLYVESEERAFIPPHPPDDHHAEPQAVGGRNKKRWYLEYSIRQNLKRRLRVTRHLGCLAIQHTQAKPIGADGECRDDPHDHAGDEHEYCRHHILDEDIEEEHPPGKPPIVAYNNLEQLGHLLPDRRGGDGSSQERGGEDQGQNQDVRFYGPVEHSPEIQFFPVYLSECPNFQNYECPVEIGASSE